MNIGWLEECFLMDSSVDGAGFGSTPASEAELRSEAQFAETRGWAASLEVIDFGRPSAVEMLLAGED
eukprot:12734243-Alexandrium_andersonii.AAC.1